MQLTHSAHLAFEYKSNPPKATTRMPVYMIRRKGARTNRYTIRRAQNLNPKTKTERWKKNKTTVIKTFDYILASLAFWEHALLIKMRGLSYLQGQTPILYLKLLFLLHKHQQEPIINHTGTFHLSQTKKFKQANYWLKENETNPNNIRYSCSFMHLREVCCQTINSRANT